MSSDAIVMLKDEHKEVKALFKRFDELKESPGRALEQVVEQVFRELVIHTKIEEEIFYPLAKRTLEEDNLIYEANEEHHVVDLLMEEISSLSSSDEAYVAKFVVLKENVEHHIEEEESDLFPKVREALGRNELQEAGEKMMLKREELEADMPVKESSKSD